MRGSVKYREHKASAAYATNILEYQRAEKHAKVIHEGPGSTPQVSRQESFQDHIQGKEVSGHKHDRSGGDSEEACGQCKASLLTLSYENVLLRRLGGVRLGGGGGPSLPAWVLK